MIQVQLTERNWEIYTQLCELDAEFQVCEDEESRSDIIALAKKLCMKIEVKK